MKSNISPFDKKGFWFKGNTHTHTNAFDGFSPSKEVIELYKNSGYNFLSITDHNIYKTYSEFNDENFLMLHGVELSYGVQIDDMELLEEMNQKVLNGNMSQEEMLDTISSFTPKDTNPKRVPHVIAIAKDQNMSSFSNIDSSNFSDIQVMIDLANKNNCISIIAHPCWSKLNFSDVENLKDYTAIETYNHVCEEYFAGGDSSAIWDQLLNANIPTNALACDDMHDLSISLGGYIMVKAENFDYKSIVNAIEKGDYYSSQGPIIHALNIENGVVSIECSKVKSIRFIPDIVFGRTYRDESASMESCSHKLNGLEKHIRIEITDENNKKAFTNPIYL